MLSLSTVQVWMGKEQFSIEAGLYCSLWMDGWSSILIKTQVHLLNAILYIHTSYNHKHLIDIRVSSITLDKGKQRDEFSNLRSLRGNTEKMAA